MREGDGAGPLVRLAARIIQRRVLGNENTAAEAVRLDREPMAFAILADEKRMRSAYGNLRIVRTFNTHDRSTLAGASRAPRPII